MTARTGVESEISSPLQMGSLKQLTYPRLFNLRVVRKVLRKFVNWRLVRCSGDCSPLRFVEVFLFVPQQTSTDLRDARSNPTRLFIV